MIWSIITIDKVTHIFTINPKTSKPSWVTRPIYHHTVPYWTESQNWVIKRKWRKRTIFDWPYHMTHFTHFAEKKEKKIVRSIRACLLSPFSILSCVDSSYFFVHFVHFGNALQFHNCWKILRIYFTLRSIYLRLNGCLEAFLFLKPITNCLGFRAKYPLISINYAILSQRPPHPDELKSPLKKFESTTWCALLSPTFVVSN